MAQHRLSHVNLKTKTAVCTICGPVKLWIDPKGKRFPRCSIGHDLYLERRRVYGEQMRRKVPRKFCRIVKVDRETMTGICAKCGPVQVKPRQFGKYFTCINSWNATAALAYTSSGCGLTRKEAVEFVSRIGTCQNHGCGKRLRGSGNQRGQGHVDHDHTTGKVRGVLCNACNRALGFLRDDPAVLTGLLAYLKNPPGYTTT